MVMGLPVGAGEPLVLRLAGGERLVDLDLVEAGAARHRVLIGNHVTARPQPPLKAHEPQSAGNGKAAPVGETREIDADQVDCVEAVGEPAQEPDGCGVSLADTL